MPQASKLESSRQSCWCTARSPMRPAGTASSRGCSLRQPRSRRDRDPQLPVATGKYEHRVIEGGIGHNLPQEAPQAFAQAIIDAGSH